MKNKLLTTILLAGITTSSYAYTIVSEHLECHGNADSSGCRIEHLATKSSMGKTQSVGAIASVSDQDARSTQATQVKSYHEVHIRNGDDHKKRYHYYFSVASIQMRNVYSADIDLDGKEEFSTSTNMFGTVQENDRGSYDIQAVTDISNAESDRQEAHATLHVK